MHTKEVLKQNLHFVFGCKTNEINGLHRFKPNSVEMKLHYNIKSNITL